MKKIYIAGAGGMLGDAFYRQLHEYYELKCTDILPNEQWLSFMDFRNYKAYSKDVKIFKPDILIHMGAMTDVDKCETEVNNAYLTNTMSVEYAVRIANELDIPVVYISTSAVFDGTKEIYNDWDIPNPSGVYAKTKYYGERVVAENAKKYFIIRAGWMMGGGTKDKKFVKKIYDKIKTLPKELQVVNDKKGTSTYTYDFAWNTHEVIRHGQYGTYNMACRGISTRYDMAMFMIKHLDLQEKIKVIPAKSEDFSSYGAPRPANECIENKRLEILGINFMRNWKVCLEEYLNSGLLEK